MSEEKRVGFIGIIIESKEADIHKVNDLISEMSHIIIGRMGIPYREKKCAVITLVVDASTDEVGKLTGRLGQIEGVSVKSALSKSVLSKGE